MTQKKDNFFKKAFRDMGENAKSQHQVDKANLEAVKAESKVNWEQAKLSPSQRQQLINEQQQEQIAQAQKRTQEANQKLEHIHQLKNK